HVESSGFVLLVAFIEWHRLAPSVARRAPDARRRVGNELRDRHDGVPKRGPLLGIGAVGGGGAVGPGDASLGGRPRRRHERRRRDGYVQRPLRALITGDFSTRRGCQPKVEMSASL